MINYIQYIHDIDHFDEHVDEIKRYINESLVKHEKNSVKHIVNDIYLVHKPELKNISEEQIEEAYK